MQSGDVIALTGLRVRGFHGVFEHERRDGQDFVVDAVLEVSTAAAAASDDLADTVDYGDLAQRLAAVVGGEPVNLLETLVGRLAAECLRDPRVAAATVTVHKPQAPIPLAFADVSVTIRRERAMTRAVLSIGSNLGDRAATLAERGRGVPPVAAGRRRRCTRRRPGDPSRRTTTSTPYWWSPTRRPARSTGSTARTPPSRPPAGSATSAGGRARWTST